MKKKKKIVWILKHIIEELLENWKQNAQIHNLYIKEILRLLYIAAAFGNIFL